MTSLNFGNFSRRIKNRRSFICGIKGHKLTLKEINFIKKYKPWGVILFKRNIKSIYQTRKLTEKIRNIFNDNFYPILIDEEGGKVTRLENIVDNTFFSPSFFGKLFLKDKKKFNIFLEVYINQISSLLKNMGINLNSVPVLDQRRNGYHKIVGDRAFSDKTNVISIIGDLVIKKFHNKNIVTIMKHIPGHGLAKVDSHKSLPIVDKNLNYLIQNDFKTFKNKESLLAMTAHILFKNIDKTNCVTHSKNIIKIIREKIKFKNILISDDISMNALKYSTSKNTLKAFTAGCNIVLHCNANLAEMKKVAKNAPFLDQFLIKKTSQLYKILS